MSDLSEIEDTPHTKNINVFQVKETITSKNEYNKEISQQPPLAKQNKEKGKDNKDKDKVEEEEKEEIIPKSTITDKIPTVEKDIKLEEADINQIYFSHQTQTQSKTSAIFLSMNSSFYIHCKRCLLIIATENKLQTENALYYVMNQPIIQNLLQRQKEYKDYSYTELKCKRCGLLIGCILLDNAKNTYPTYFIKKYIVSKDNRQMAFSLLGLRSDLLLKLQSQLCSFFDKSTAIIDISKQTKESLDKYAYPKERVDALFIVHKIEGRVFLLGKNGFYNSVIREFNKKLNQNIYFILLFKETEEKCTEAYYNGIIDDLITKGGQESLKPFMDSNRIICINDLVFDKEINRTKGIFKHIYDSSYCILSDRIITYENDDEADDSENNLNDHYHMKSYYDQNEYSPNTDNQIKDDDDLIHNFIDYFYEGRNKLFANCSML